MSTRCTVFGSTSWPTEAIKISAVGPYICISIQKISVLGVIVLAMQWLLVATRSHSAITLSALFSDLPLCLGRLLWI